MESALLAFVTALLALVILLPGPGPEGEGSEASFHAVLHCLDERNDFPSLHSPPDPQALRICTKAFVNFRDTTHATYDTCTYLFTLRVVTASHARFSGPESKGLARERGVNNECGREGLRQASYDAHTHTRVKNITLLPGKNRAL